MVETDNIYYRAKEKEQNGEKYSALLFFFDRKYWGEIEHTNYVKPLISMKYEIMVKDLIKTYNKVLQKLLTIYYHSEENIQNDWFVIWTKNKYWVYEDLKSYLNEQIKRLFDESIYSDKFALECITNLRDGDNEVAIRDYVASKSSASVNAILRDIIQHKDSLKSTFSSDNVSGETEYAKYIEDIKFLINNGYHKGYENIYFETKENILYTIDTHVSDKKDTNVSDKNNQIAKIAFYILIAIFSVILVYVAIKVYIAIIIFLALLSFLKKS